jgi:O-antigen/teichoic acid export membrane protein
MAETKLSERAAEALHRIAGDKTLRGIALIGGGTAVGQAIMVVATPLVSRLYGPHEYGAMAVFSSFLGIASILVTCRFEVAVPLPKEDREARNILSLALILGLFTSGLVCLSLLVWQFFRKATNPDPLFKHLSWTLPLGMLSIGVYQTLAYWATRKRLYRPMSATRMNQSIASVATQILLYRLPPPGLGLVLSSIVSQAFGLRPLYLAFRDTSQKASISSMATLLSTGRKYLNISVYGTATAVTTAIGDGLPSLLLAKTYGLEVAGIFLMASRVLAIPARMVGAAVSQVFMGEASQRLREDPQSVPKYFRNVYQKLLWVGGGVLVLGGICPTALPWILGSKWDAAGAVAAILAPVAAADITVSPLYNITVIGNRPKLQLFTGLLPMGFSIFGLGIPILLGLSERIALITYSICRCLGYFFTFLVYRRVAKNIGGDSNQEDNCSTRQP